MAACPFGGPRVGGAALQSVSLRAVRDMPLDQSFLPESLWVVPLRRQVFLRSPGQDCGGYASIGSMSTKGEGGQG